MVHLKSQSQPIAVFAWVLSLFSGVLFLLACISYRATFFFWQRSLAGDHTAAIATAMMGSLLLLPSIAAMRVAKSKFQNRLFTTTRMDNIILRVAAFITACPVLWVGLKCLMVALIICNSRYLNWFRDDGLLRYYAHSYSLWKNVLIGNLMTSLGLFLICFSISKRGKPEPNIEHSQISIKQTEQTEQTL